MPDDASSAPLPSQPSRPVRGCLLALGCLIAVVLLLVGWYAAARLHDASVARKLEKQARLRGEPLTLAEVGAFYPSVPEAENAALALIKVWQEEQPARWEAFLRGDPSLPEEQLLPSDEAVPYVGQRGIIPAPGETLDPEARQAAEDFVHEKARHLAAVRLALQRPRSRFPIRLQDGPMSLLPHLAGVKREVQFFRVAALMAAVRGEADTYISSLETMVALANLLEPEPLLISQLVRNSCLLMTLDSMEYLLSAQALTAGQLARLRQLCERMQCKDALRRAMMGERASALSVLSMPAETLARLSQQEGEEDARTQASAQRAGMVFLTLIGQQAADRRLMCEYMGEAIALLGSDWPEVMRRAERNEKYLEKNLRGIPPRIFSGLLLPALAKTATKAAGVEARRRAALAALAVERCRGAEAGSLPADLNKLVPKYLAVMQVDPFDGQPLRYLRQDKGYIVYSVGPDRKDDKGKKRPRKGGATAWDETFAVNR